MDSTDKYCLEIEIGDLCKALKTSRPEQYIYTYIKEIFPTAIRGKKFDWMNNSEFDIFIPELNLAIEYDGGHWHKKKNSGLIEDRKNNLAKENNITLFRIREKGLNKTSCDYYIYDYNEKYTNIDKAINAIINFINKKYDKNIKTINDFDFNDIKIKTLENLKIQNREQSIIGIWSEVEKYWNYKDNNGIKPENVRPTQKNVLNAICPYCKKM